MFDGYEFSPDQRAVTDVLSEKGITTTDQAFAAFASVESFNRMLESFGEGDPDSGHIIDFIRELEIKDLLQHSVDGGTLTKENLDKILALDLPFATLVRFFSPLDLPSGGKGNKADTEDYEKADELIESEQLIRLNNLLAEQGLGRMTGDDFAGFRGSLTGKSSRAGRILTESTQKSVAGRASDDPDDLPVVLENQVELTDIPAEWLEWQPNHNTICESEVLTFPLPVSGPGVETSYPFIQEGDTSSVRQVLINKKGLALFRVDSETADGNVFIFGSGQGTEGIYLNENTTIAVGQSLYFRVPVFEGDLCRPFNIITNGGAAVTLVDVIEPEDVEPSGIEGGLVEIIEVPGGLSLTQGLDLMCFHRAISACLFCLRTRVIRSGRISAF